MNTQIRGEALRFLVVGASNTAVTYALYLALLPVAGYSLAYTIAYAIGIAIAYLLNTQIVFRVGHTLAGLALFPLVYVAQYIAGIVVLYLTINLFRVPKQFALIASIVTTVPITFLLSRCILTRSADSRTSEADRGGQ